MNRFFGTFLSGAEEIVEGMLRERLEDVRILALPDGAVEFETAVPYSDLNLFCFNNLFLVLCEETAPAGEEGLNGWARRVLSLKTDWDAAGKNSGKIKTFRLVVSQENKLVSLETSLRGRLEKRLSQASGLRVDRSRPDTEFWLLSRREGNRYFLKRLSRHTAYDKLLDPGELHPELAYMMCWLTSPKHTDIVLDPFCGHGAIPLQRCKRFPYREILAFDKDEKVLARARQKLPKRPELRLEARDAFELRKLLPAGSVDAVITDPPWGFYGDVGMEIPEFYRRLLPELSFLLKSGGRLVLLTAAKEEFLSALSACPELLLEKSYRVLVSGKKCGLYKVAKHDCPT